MNRETKPVILQRKILDRMQAEPRVWTSVSLARELHSNRLSVAEALRALRHEGRVRSTRRGESLAWSLGATEAT